MNHLFRSWHAKWFLIGIALVICGDFLTQLSNSALYLGVISSPGGGHELGNAVVIRDIINVVGLVTTLVGALTALFSALDKLLQTVRKLARSWNNVRSSSAAGEKTNNSNQETD